MDFDLSAKLKEARSRRRRVRTFCASHDTSVDHRVIARLACIIEVSPG